MIVVDWWLVVWVISFIRVDASIYTLVLWELIHYMRSVWRYMHCWFILIFQILEVSQNLFQIHLLLFVIILIVIITDYRTLQLLFKTLYFILQIIHMFVIFASILWYFQLFLKFKYLWLKIFILISLFLSICIYWFNHFKHLILNQSKQSIFVLVNKRMSIYMQASYNLY